LIKFTQQYQAPFQQVGNPQVALQASSSQQQFLPQIQNTSRMTQQFQVPPQIQYTLGMPLEGQNPKTPRYQYTFDMPQQSQTPIRPQVQMQS